MQSLHIVDLRDCERLIALAEHGSCAAEVLAEVDARFPDDVPGAAAGFGRRRASA